MPESEDKSPTLASLRTTRGRVRAAKRSSATVMETNQPTQVGLFSPQAGALSLPLEADEPPTCKPVEESRPRISGAATERRIWGVRALVTGIRQQVETNYADLWVEGEISNCRPAPSGHIYFTLKDGDAQLPVVLFRRHASLLRFRPADGLAVLVRGRMSVYESRGQLQLIAETVEPCGVGTLQLAFEQLKARLLAEGLFDAARKRPLPSFPKCIGIITSPTGAVVRDIVTIIRRRHARLNLLVYPALMQGPSSPASVVAAIRWFNAHPELVDVIVLARGGGSQEDLLGFNDEELARTIGASSLPIVSAIGHETDFTIADFVADLRAATPSAAAELITAVQHRVEEHIDVLAARVRRAGRFRLTHARQRYILLAADSALSRLHDAISRRGQRLDELRMGLNASAQRAMRTPAQRFLAIADRLRRQDFTAHMRTMHQRRQNADQRILHIFARSVTSQKNRLNRASTRLETLSPLAVLSRGYALVYSADGSLLSSTADITQGESIHARLAHGTIVATVTQTIVNEADVMESNKL